MTLDGVIQNEENDGDGFKYGGWFFPYADEVTGAVVQERLAKPVDLLLGRKTWQGHGAAFDPMPKGDPFGDVMNAMQKYVVSTTLTTAAAWRNSNLITRNVVAEVRALKAQAGKNIGIDGSSVLVHTLAQNDLVDEYSLLVFPLVLGGGKKLFPDALRLNLRLIESRQFPTGVVLMRYAALSSDR